LPLFFFFSSIFKYPLPKIKKGGNINHSARWHNKFETVRGSLPQKQKRQDMV